AAWPTRSAPPTSSSSPASGTTGTNRTTPASPGATNPTGCSPRSSASPAPTAACTSCTSPPAAATATNFRPSMPDVLRTLALVPTYDERENIEEMLRRLRAANPDVDILVLDDSSPDGTAELAKGLAPELGNLDVEVRAVKD